MLHDFWLQDISLKDFPEEIQAHVKAKRYIDARKTESEKDMKVFRTKLLYAMPKIPLGEYSRADNMELRAMNFTGLYNRIHTFKHYNKNRREQLNVLGGAGDQDLLYEPESDHGHYDKEAFSDESDNDDYGDANDYNDDIVINVIVHQAL